MSLNFVLTCYLQVGGGREAKRVFYYVPSLSIRQQGYHIKVPKNFKERNNVPTFFDVWEVGGSRERENGSVILHLNCNGIHEPAGIINCEPLVTTTGTVAAFERKKKSKTAC